MNTGAIRELVRSECLKESNGFGPAFLDEHILPVLRYSRLLAGRLGADTLVVELAAYLHDLSAIRDMSVLPSHHIESARIARQLLDDQGWPAAIRDRVCRVIETHSMPVQPGEGNPEQVCLSNADVVSHFARPAYWCFYLYGVRKFSYEEGLEWWRRRANEAWFALAPEAQALAASDRQTVLHLLDEDSREKRSAE
ncbi:MAG: HD domain-containing protein [Bryobacteraceae bacterium]